MTIQEVAYSLLSEHKRPMTAKELAEIALERGLVHSSAQKPVDSHAQTLEKNIRDGVYNKPELKFVDGPQRPRLLKLPEWEDQLNTAPSILQTPRTLIYRKRAAAEIQPHTVSPLPQTPGTAEFKARIPSDLLEQVQLAVQAKIADGFDQTVAALLRRGVSAAQADIRRGLMDQLDRLEKGQA